MQTWLIILLISIYVFCTVVPLFVLNSRGYFKLAYYSYLCQMSIPYCKTLGNYIINYGVKGSGKTTLQNGLTHIFTYINMMQAQSDVRECSGLFPQIDFKKINAVVDCLVSNGVTNVEEILMYLPREETSKIFGYIDLYLEHELALDFFRRYLYAYVALSANNYVYCASRSFYCFLTHNVAMEAKKEYTEIKEAYENHVKPMRPYTTLIIDEEGIQGNVSTDFKEVAKSDKGTSKFAAIIRHLFLETSRVIYTIQEATRKVSEEREQGTAFLFLDSNSRQLVHVFNFRYRFYIWAYDKLTNYYEKREAKLDKKLSKKFRRRLRFFYNGYLKNMNRYNKKRYAPFLEAAVVFSSMVDFYQQKVSQYIEKRRARFFRHTYYIKRLRLFLRKRKSYYDSIAYVRFVGQGFPSLKVANAHHESKDYRFSLCFPRQWTDGASPQFRFHPIYIELEANAIGHDEIIYNEDLRFEYDLYSDSAHDFYVSCLTKKGSAPLSSSLRH